MNGFVYSLRYLLNVSIVFSLTFGGLAYAEAPADNAAIAPASAPANDEARGLMVVENTDPKLPSLKVEFQTKTIGSEDEPQELAKTLEDAKSADTVIVSTDETEVLKQAAQGATNKVALLPFGKAIRASADKVGGLNSAIRNSSGYLKQAFLKDKVGFSIATFSLGTEIYKWIHVTSASNFVITSNIIYAILWSAIFVDKDTWSRGTKPLQRTFRKLFKLSQVIPEHPTMQDTAMKFLAGLSMSMILNSGRAAIVGIDELARGVFNATALSMPYVMGAVMTAVGFSWSELIGHIDDHANPRTKKITRLVMNSRSVIISWFAASAMLMHPEEFGIRPWLTVAVSGLAGLVLYSTSKTWIEPLERFASRIATRRCEALFASPAVSN